MLDCSGPDADSTSKLEQCDIFKRLYVQYRSGKLKKCLLSHNIHHMQSEFTIMRHIIESQDSDLSANKHRYPIRLGKIPASAY